MEGFIAHQFPDFVASITAPIVMVIILLTVDWRFGLASLVGIILAFVAEFIGFGSGEMKENMGKYQKALEEMNNASVEYVRGMSVVKAFCTSNFRCAEQNHVYFRVVHADQRECGPDGRDIEHSRNAGNGSS